MDEERRTIEGEGAKPAGRSETARDPSNHVTRRRLNDEGSSLSETELEEVRESRKLRPLAVYETVRQEGEDELARPGASLWWSGLAAGLSIGFSLFTEAALRAHLPDAPWRPLVENWGYAVGFLIVILGRQQLFTEITLTATLPILARPTAKGVLALLRLWAIVLLANMVGTAIYGGAMALEVMGEPEITRAALSIAEEAVASGASETLLHGIAAGWIMATLVWLMPSSEAFGFFVIALLTYLIALFDLAHIVAGSVEVFLLVFHGERSFGELLWNFQIPALAGNIIGGAALFALLSYGQVVKEMDGNDNGRA
ncbi:membrane protein [Aureimonas endophytica]|uniref:Membrane protein n=1 Tax=Aureimonas endophytica TaxID=2027858 RepID=A0A916ZDB4_9HYPH|nr:formate/nitrite transporter family protein [Aureimonas endophytica]GGD89257.1 membrane protein [Aureimonas endophytica]